MKKGIIIGIVIIMFALICSKLIFKAKETSTEEIEELTGKIALYFKGEDNLKLEKEYRNVSMDRIKENIGKTIVEEVLKGPTSENLKSTIPEGTKLIDVNIVGNQAKVNLSNEFIDNQKNNAADSLLAIYSIVNSLTEITEIEEVKFYIDNVEAESYKGYFEMNKPFVRSI